MASDSAQQLASALEQSRPAIEAGMQAAEQELAGLRARERELERLIARARAVLATDDDVTLGAPNSRLTLHDAMALVLKENNNRWITVQELADEINRRRLYEKRDRSLVEPGQIHARANKYDHMFEKKGAEVRAR